jgi:hypothetical protein
MRPPPLLLCLLLALSMAACVTPRADTESEARRLLEVARALETSRDLKEAAHQYSMIAERFPNAIVFPVAVRRAALLYANTANPGHSDSLSLFWWRRYLELPVLPQEKENATLAVNLLSAVDSLRLGLARQTTLADSLFSLSRKQTNALSAQEKRIQDLEAELHHTAEELRKLKEIDVKLSKTRKR